MYAIGLMSGTSLDGVDACLIDIESINGKINYQLIEFITKPFSETLLKEIETCIALEKSHVQAICSLNFKLGHEFSEACKLVCLEANVSLSEIEFIASHGQTIWHQPTESGSYVKSTLQIGESAVIAYETNCQVISNFRVMDMAAGGQGAPLVAYTDYLLYKNDHKNIVLQNIGGIGNMTYLPKGCSIDDVISFDTGPGNMMIDYIMQKYFNKPYDKDGLTARSGHVVEPLLNELMSHPFINEKPPKTTGREMFGKEFVEQILTKYHEVDKLDLITTFTTFVSLSIVNNYKQYLNDIDEVIISGGGSYNTYLVDLIKQQLSCEVKTLEEIGENASAKEAIAFALLGYQTLHHQNNNVKNSTGASRDVILGNITPKPWR
ncbi:anhydro-N-acetylmuramic acid kinase [Mycoplasmatota bacterium]|nr:anhydro-N-acetylmuramic acid kinase [Mycoplasmatota bacterium]